MNLVENSNNPMNEYLSIWGYGFSEAKANNLDFSCRQYVCFPIFAESYGLSGADIVMHSVTK